MTQLIRESQKGCLRSAFIQIISVLIVIPLSCIFIILPLYLFQYMPNASIWVMILPMSFFLLVVIGGGIGFYWFTISKRARHLDAIFEPMGLRGERFNINFRKYTGRWQGREVGVFTYRGPRMIIELSTNLQTRLGIQTSSSFAQKAAKYANREVIQSSDPGMEDLQGYVIDREWGEALFADPAVQKILSTLVKEEPEFSYVQVLLRPGWIGLQLHGSGNVLDFKFPVTESSIRHRMSSLLDLIEIAEGLNPPTVEDEVSSGEKMAESIRSGNSKIALIVLVGIFAFLFAVSIFAVVVGFLLANLN